MSTLYSPYRCSVDGLQISNFSSRCVIASPLVKQFYAAIDAGAHEAFIHQPGLWWGCPILDHPQGRWASLYTRNSTFRGWAESQRAAGLHATVRPGVHAAAQPGHAAAQQQGQPPPAARPPPPHAAPPPPKQQQPFIAPPMPPMPAPAHAAASPVPPASPVAPVAPAARCCVYCSRAPAGGQTRNGNPFITCCRTCGVTKGGGAHCGNCVAARMPIVVD